MCGEPCPNMLSLLVGAVPRVGSAEVNRYPKVAQSSGTALSRRATRGKERGSGQSRPRVWTDPPHRERSRRAPVA